MEFLQLFLVGHLILAFVAGFVANSKGRSSVGYFFLSLFFSFLIAIIVLLAVPNLKGRSNEPTRSCPYCAEMILAQAKVCKHCSRDVQPLESPKASVEVPQHWLLTFGSVMIFVSLTMLGIWGAYVHTWVDKVYDSGLLFQRYATLAIELLILAGSIVAVVVGAKLTKRRAEAVKGEIS